MLDEKKIWFEKNRPNAIVPIYVRNRGICLSRVVYRYDNTVMARLPLASPMINNFMSYVHGTETI